MWFNFYCHGINLPQVFSPEHLPFSIGDFCNDCMFISGNKSNGTYAYAGGGLVPFWPFACVTSSFVSMICIFQTSVL